MARTLSSMDGVITRSPDQKTVSQDGATVFQPGMVSYNLSASQTEPGVYLRQLSTLHAVGILTDEEFTAAKGRLFGS